MPSIPPPEAAPSHRPLVLVVDDDAATLLGLERFLAYEYDVVTAADGVAGLARATGKPRPDVIVADVWMPKLDGIEMVRRIRHVEELKHVPVIFLTGQTSTGSMVAGLSVGARAYLFKPIDLDALERKLHGALHTA